MKERERKGRENESREIAREKKRASRSTCINSSELNTRNNTEANLRNSATFLWVASNGQQLAKRSTRKLRSPFITISCMEGQCSDHVQWYTARA